eukprot:COSAG02_NODE_3410_length_6788_cov_20.669009_2_plen_90_part_00
MYISSPKKKPAYSQLTGAPRFFRVLGSGQSKSDIYDLSMRICIQIQSHVLKMSTRLHGVSLPTAHHLIIKLVLSMVNYSVNDIFKYELI